MTQICRSEALDTLENYTELQDGLFCFAKQGLYVLDMIVCISEDETVYQIDIFEHRDEDVCAELYNFSHLTREYASQGVYENYQKIGEQFFTTKDEAYSFFIEKLKELNHF